MKTSILNWLTEQFGADKALHEELYGQYVVDMRTQLAELEASRSNGDMSRLATVAHAMKGMALQMGDDETAECCRMLQAAGKAADPEACARLSADARALVAAL